MHTNIPRERWVFQLEDVRHVNCMLDVNGSMIEAIICDACAANIAQTDLIPVERSVVHGLIIGHCEDGELIVLVDDRLCHFRVHPEDERLYELRYESDYAHLLTLPQWLRVACGSSKITLRALLMRAREIERLIDEAA